MADGLVVQASAPVGNNGNTMTVTVTDSADDSVLDTSTGTIAGDACTVVIDDTETDTWPDSVDVTVTVAGVDSDAVTIGRGDGIYTN